jgi:hypothetical protein
VKLPQDARFREEWRRFGLRFTCEHCGLFDAERERCAHGFPTEPHRSARYENPDAAVLFCKDFELE